MDTTAAFEAERPRLAALAGRILSDHAEGEDVVQQAWLRLHRTAGRGEAADIDSLPAWLTTVTTRLCLDRLKARTPTPTAEVEPTGPDPDRAGPVGHVGDVGPDGTADPAEQVAAAQDVGAALHVVLDRLSPTERVALVLHDSFGVDFATVAAVLDTTPTAARKLASRARAKVAGADHRAAPADWEVVDAFMAAARAGDFDRLLRLLAPDAGVTADDAALLVGTPARIDGRTEVARFFDGAAHAALAVYAGNRPAAAWFDRGTPRVVFEFTIVAGLVGGIRFRAAPEVLGTVVRRDGHIRRTPLVRESSPDTGPTAGETP